jgi:hypothetical protein
VRDRQGSTNRFGSAPALTRANLQNYDELLITFSWADARALLDGLPGGGLQILAEGDFLRRSRDQDA